MKLDTIGKNIRKFRLARKLRQEDLAEKTDLTTNYIGMVERGEKIPSLETFIKIVNALGVLKIVVTDTDLEASKTVADEIAKVSSQYIADNMDQSQPKIIQTAYASKTPVNNNILKNTVIGAVLGLFLAAGIVVLGYMLDDTISNADDMETRTGLKVLASLPVDETEYDGAKTKRRKKKKTQSSKSDDSKSKKRAV